MLPLQLTTAAAGTTAAAAAAEHTSVIPDIFPFSQSVFEHQKLQKSLSRSNFRKTGLAISPLLLLQLLLLLRNMLG